MQQDHFAVWLSISRSSQLILRPKLRINAQSPCSECFANDIFCLSQMTHGRSACSCYTRGIHYRPGNYKMTSARSPVRFLWTLASSLLFPAARELATGRDGSVQSKGRPTTDSARRRSGRRHWSLIQFRASCQMSIDIECNTRRTRYVENEASKHLSLSRNRLELKKKNRAKEFN